MTVISNIYWQLIKYFIVLIMHACVYINLEVNGRNDWVEFEEEGGWFVMFYVSENCHTKTSLPYTQRQHCNCEMSEKIVLIGSVMSARGSFN